MGKIYLQEKIQPDPGKYIIVGKDGFLTTGDIPIEAHPQIMITTDPGRDATEFTAYCNNQKRNPQFTRINNTTFACDVSEFGTWRIVINEEVEPDPEDPSTNVLVEYIEVTEIRIYYMTLTIENSSAGGGGAAALDAYTWEQIKGIISQGTASSIFHIGDAKKITFKHGSTFGTTSLSDFETYAYIIGIDHNSAVEGQGLTFQIGYVNNSNTNSIAFVDEFFNTQQNTDNKSYHINRGWAILIYHDTNSEPWYYDSEYHCAMYDLLNDSSDASSFINCLPDELVNNMDSKPIYTDNGFSGYRTITSDFGAAKVSVSKSRLFLLSEYEIFGTTTYSSSFETVMQAQYAFYQNNQNSKIKYKHNNTTQAASYWTRSRIVSPDSYFCCVSASGTADRQLSLYSLGISPAFCISNNKFTSTNIYITTPGSKSTSTADYSSYIRVNKNNNTYTDYYTSGKINIDSTVTNIQVIGKTGYKSTTSQQGITSTYINKVGVKLNGTVVGESTPPADRTRFYTLHTISDLQNKGSIQISLVSGTTTSYSNATVTNYVLINTNAE